MSRQPLMTTELQFEQLGMSETSALLLAEALRSLAFVDPADIATAINTITRCGDFGVFTDPTFFVRNPDARRVGQANIKLLNAALILRNLLPSPLRKDAKEDEATGG